MRACWFCREPVTEPDAGAEPEAGAEVAVVRAATAFPAAPLPPQPRPRVVSEAPAVVEDVEDRLVTTPDVPLVQDVPAPVPYTEPTVARRSVRVRWGRSLLLGLVGAVVVTAGALAFESLWTRHLPPDAEDVAMTRSSYPDVGAAVSHPSGWQIQETRRRVTFLSGEAARDRSTRGFRVSDTDIPYSRVDDQIEQLADRLLRYSPLETFADSVDGEPATVHVFVADDLRFEQWWIDRGKRTLRIDLWSRPADEHAPDLNRRIVDEIQVL